MNDRSNGAADAETNGNPQQSSHAKSGGTRAAERIAALDADVSIDELVGTLERELDEATQAAEEAKAGWQRARADFANYKRRSEQEKAESGNRASDSLLLKVVALADDFDLAIEHVPADVAASAWMEGIGAIDRKLRQILETAGVKPMDTEGQPFDPHEQQAISYEDTIDAPDGTVIKELQRGYYIGERVLRPAFVAVARNDDSTTTDDD